MVEQLEFIQARVESASVHLVNLPWVDVGHLDFFFGRIVDDEFEHGVLLLEHGKGVVALHGEVFNIEVHTLHVHLKAHLIVVKGLGDVAEFFQSLDIVVHQSNLLQSVLRHIVGLGSLHDDVLACLLVRELVESVGNLRHLHCRTRHLVVDGHLELQADSGIILEGFGHIVCVTVCPAIGHRYWWRKIVVDLCHSVHLWQQFSLILANGDFSLHYLVTASLERQIVVNSHLQTLAQCERLLCVHRGESAESETKIQSKFHFLFDNV